jgi:hypothetical protein
LPDTRGVKFLPRMHRIAIVAAGGGDRRDDL